jgi:hypothetical protein
MLLVDIRFQRAIDIGFLQDYHLGNRYRINPLLKNTPYG